MVNCDLIFFLCCITHLLFGLVIHALDGFTKITIVWFGIFKNSADQSLIILSILYDSYHANCRNRHSNSSTISALFFNTFRVYADSSTSLNSLFGLSKSYWGFCTLQFHLKCTWLSENKEIWFEMKLTIYLH